MILLLLLLIIITIIIITIIIITLKSLITAFTAKKSVLMMSKYDKEIGALPPLGYFDPLGLLKDADQARFDRLRYVETKHGRIAMLAVLGHIITAKGDRFPGEISPGFPFSSIKGGLGALTTLPQQELWEIVAFIGLMEWGFGSIQKNSSKESEENPSFKRQSSA